MVKRLRRTHVISERGMNALTVVMQHWYFGENEALHRALDYTCHEVDKKREQLQYLNGLYNHVNESYQMCQRILHEIYRDYPIIRMTYRDIVDFDDLIDEDRQLLAIEDEDTETDEEYVQNVRRRINFDE